MGTGRRPGKQRKDRRGRSHQEPSDASPRHTPGEELPKSGMSASVKAVQTDPRISGAIGLFLGLLPWGLGLLGITVNVWLGAVVLLSALSCLSFAVWIWKPNWGHLRIGIVLLGFVGYCFLVTPAILRELSPVSNVSTGTKLGGQVKLREWGSGEHGGYVIIDASEILFMARTHYLVLACMKHDPNTDFYVNRPISVGRPFMIRPGDIRLQTQIGAKVMDQIKVKSELQLVVLAVPHGVDISRVETVQQAIDVGAQVGANPRAPVMRKSVLDRLDVKD